MTSWRPLLAGTVGLFLVILAFLAGQLKAGADPALRRAAATTGPGAPVTREQPADAFAEDDAGPYEGAPDLAPPGTHQS